MVGSGGIYMGILLFFHHHLYNLLFRRAYKFTFFAFFQSMCLFLFNGLSKYLVLKSIHNKNVPLLTCQVFMSKFDIADRSKEGGRREPTFIEHLLHV